MNLQLKPLSAMTKVFLDEEPPASFVPEGVFGNECFCFQLAWYSPDDLTLKDLALTVELSPAPLAACTRVFQVGQVPAALPCYPGADDGQLRRAPGLFPDPLYPLQAPLRAVGGQWHALFFELDPAALDPGPRQLQVRLVPDDGSPAAQAQFSFTVLPGLLPPQRLLFTQWLHYDCLARWYNLEPMSEQHLACVWNYVDEAVAHGMNMLLVPLFTPPLDTLPGAERLTAQLVDVRLENGVYSFGFERLHAFLQQAQHRGIRAFEMTPLFTQWGAAFAPKIMARVNGASRRLFGWDTPADSPEYVAFLEAFLPRLADRLHHWGLAEVCFFHVSDEPEKPEHRQNYRRAYELLHRCLPGFSIMDAVGSAAFFREGTVKQPIAATNAFASLREAGAEELWVYYCCAQYQKVSNHFLTTPGWRTRCFGLQLYRQNVWGFLHWGLNFWNSKYSQFPIDPYCTTDGGGVYPAGDPFIVYPGPHCAPIASQRQKLLRQAFYDDRALQLLEQLAGRARAEAVLDRFGPMDFERYPAGEQAVRTVRAAVNAAILEAQQAPSSSYPFYY